MFKKLIAVCCATFLLIAASHSIADSKQPAPSKAQLTAITQCVTPYVRLHTTKAVVFAIYDGPIYHVMRHAEDNEKHELLNEFLLKLNGKKCEVVYSDQMDEGPPISEVFPNDFGRIATRNSYRYYMSIYGKNTMQKSLANSTGLNQIQKEELRRLGFKVK
jgi:hypothetical protein